jgi:1-deoxy-D-xylulose-5-phosphate synthase
MCQGNKLEKIRDEFPDRFFDTGICESHAVAFAAGQAKAGLRPIVDIYSTFLQRSFDQIFQEVTLQNLPVVFTLDRAGLTGPDGPTHHGCFDIAYMRCFPNMVVMAPGDAWDVPAMLGFALRHDGPISLRYPKANAVTIAGARSPIELGRSEALRTGRDGTILCLGTLLSDCLAAADLLAADGLEVGVVNMRFAKPIDREAVERTLRETGFVVTVEEGCLQGGFGSASSNQRSALIPAASSDSAFPTASSNTASAASFSPTLASTPRAFQPPAANSPSAAKGLRARRGPQGACVLAAKTQRWSA